MRYLSKVARFGFALAGLVCHAALFAQSAPAVFVNMSTSQVASGATPTAATTALIAAPGSGWSYSAAAPIAGTTWNQILRPNPSIGSNSTSVVGQYVCNSANAIALVSATGAATGVKLTVSLDIQDLETTSTTRVEPNSGAGGTTAAAPSGLMSQAWRIYRGGNASIHKLTGLPSGAHYYVYFYGSTTTAGQGCKFILDAANSVGGVAQYLETSGGNSGNVFSYDGTTYTLSSPASANTASASANNTTWGRLHAVVDGTGAISFRTAKNAASNSQYLSGYQLMPFPVPVIGLQPAAGAGVTVGGSLTLTVSATGDGTLSYQWRKNGAPLADGPSGGGSTYSGSAGAAFTLSGATGADAGSYDVVVTNEGGSVVSTASVVTVTAGAIAPSIVSAPASATATVGGPVSFSVSANGTAPLSYQWQKSLNNVAFADIAGATSSVLSLPSVATADAGYYRVVVTNSVGSITSSVASLLVAPVIATAPSMDVVASGSTKTVSVVADAGAGSPQAIAYVWKRDGVTIANGAPFSGATTANLVITGVTAAQAGYYTVTVSNSAGAVTSAPVYIGVPSAQSVTFAPGNNASGIAIDQQLRLVFPGAPRLGKAGVLRVRDAADDSVVAVVDVSQFVTYAPGNSSAVIPNAAIRVAQGSSGGAGATPTNYYYTPIAIYGNEAWVTLPARLAYAKTYYVTLDAALLLDSTNAALPAVSSPTAWRFSTKAAGPAAATASAGPASVTVGLDGAGDFATLQGAFDWVPSGNTLLRTIEIQPGVYRDNATLGYGRNKVKVVGKGARRTDVQLIYPYAYFAPPASVSTAGTLRVEGDDATFRNLTLDNLIYHDYSPTGRPEDVNPALNGATNTLHTTGKRIVFDNVLVKGGQDTYWGNRGIAYFYGCEVWGSVDFIYGGALAVFDRCTIVQVRSTGGPVCAPSTVSAQPYGEVFLNCVFPRALVANGYPADVGVATSTFMRPWGQDGHVAVINCELGAHFSAKGWSEWSGRENTCRAIEYGSTAIGGGATTTVAQRRSAGAYWLNTVDPDYTNSAMSPTDALLVSPGGSANRVAVTVNPADYTLSAIFGHPYFSADLTGWTPEVGDAVAPTIVTPPAGKRVAVGQGFTLSVEAAGSAPLAYQWRKNGAAISGATSASYTLASAQLGDSGSYDCVVTNSAGNVVSAAAAVVVLTPFASWADGYGLDGTATGFAAADVDGDGVPNLLEYLLGGSPVANDASILPKVTLVDAVDGKHLVMEYDRAVAASAVVNAVETSADLSTWTARVPGVDADVEVIPFLGVAINVDCNSAAANNHAGLAVAPGAGTTWNSFVNPNAASGTLTTVKDSAGATTAANVTIASSGAGFSIWNDAATGAPNPLLLMQDYLFGNTYTVTVSGLPAGSYQLYVYAHGNADNQTSTVTVSGANGGGAKSTAASGNATFRDAFATGAEGVAYVGFNPVVTAAGTLQFTAGNYLNGFQLVQLTNPGFERVRVTIPYAGSRLFVRLRATN